MKSRKADPMVGFFFLREFLFLKFAKIQKVLSYHALVFLHQIVFQLQVTRGMTAFSQ